MKENRKLLKEVIEDIQRDLSDEEVLKLLAGSKISVNPSKECEKSTIGQRAADSIAKFAGSWAFIFSFVGILILWMAVNTVLAAKAFDPYAFILLNLVLPCVAAHAGTVGGQTVGPRPLAGGVDPRARVRLGQTGRGWNICSDHSRPVRGRA